MEILITSLITGNFIGVLCASIIAYYQTKHELYETCNFNKININTSLDKNLVRVDEESSAVDIAKYIIRYLHSRGYYVNIITLGSLLYFVQAQYAVKGQKCFKEKIIAGCLSAEVQEVRSHFCGWGIMDIYPIWEKMNGPVKQNKRIELIDLILEEIIKYGLDDLSELIRHQKPWQEARKTAEQVITVESLRDYFLE